MRQRESATTSAPPVASAKDFAAAATASENDASDVPMIAHRSPPQPDPACLYGLIGDVALTGSDNSETNPFAIAANFMAYLSCAIGRSAYLPIGNTGHHTRLFCLHVGRSGRGRKGDALSLVMRLDQALRALNADVAPQIHRGGLSTREGLVALIHDGYKQGAQEVAPIEDKRLWVVESEFANVLHQSRRGGNTLSAALRDCWDGVSLKPATKTNRLSASQPHLCLSGAISPTELMGLMTAREMTNGFANRFLMIWAERSQILPFPKATSQAKVDSLARKVLEILEFVRADEYYVRDELRLELTAQAQWRYAHLYRGELNDECGSDLISGLLERRAPMLLRLAMLFALSDLQLRIDAVHIDAAMAWMQYMAASVRYVFVSAAEEEKIALARKLSNQLFDFLRTRGAATRSQINTECFAGRASKTQIDAAIEQLLTATPPKICLQLLNRPQETPGTPTRVYRLV
jgi:hypothetical protein